MAVKGPVIMINLFQIMQISMKRNNLLGKKINDAGNTSKKKKKKNGLLIFYTYIKKMQVRGFGKFGVEMKFWGYIYYLVKYRMTGYTIVANEPSSPWLWRKIQLLNNLPKPCLTNDWSSCIWNIEGKIILISA